MVGVEGLNALVITPKGRGISLVFHLRVFLADCSDGIHG